MRYSGHTSLESFAKYLHPTVFGEKKAKQAVEGIDGKLTACEIVQNIQNAMHDVTRMVNARFFDKLLVFFNNGVERA
jgi:hypothetical protein